MFNTAFANTGFASISTINHVNLISCQKRSIQTTAENTLNITWNKDSCLLEIAPPNDAITQVSVVPIFDHITIAIDAGKVIIHDHNAANVITLMALLDWIITVTTVPSNQNHQSDISLYASRSKLALIASTLSFIKEIQMKSNPNHTRSFPRRTSFSLFHQNTRSIHPIAIIG